MGTYTPQTSELVFFLMHMRDIPKSNSGSAVKSFPLDHHEMLAKVRTSKANSEEFLAKLIALGTTKAKV